jgi:hypothetical protein
MRDVAGEVVMEWRVRCQRICFFPASRGALVRYGFVVSGFVFFPLREESWYANFRELG